jgi:hypothetical protein
MEETRLNLYFREIVYHNPSAKKDSVCGVFSYEALNVEEAKLGNLYLVGKISNLPPKKHKNFDFLLGVLASAIKREFYSDYRKTTLEALESALQAANIYLADFSKKGHEEWVGNLGFTCTAFSQNNIHIGQTGNMLIYLLRGNIMTNIARKFSVPEKDPQPVKTFSNIASGILEEDDKLIIATPDVLEITSSQKIRELLFQPDTEEIYNFFKDYLENQSKNKDSIIGSLACLTLEAKSKTPETKKITPKSEEIPKVFSLELEKLLNSHSEKLNSVIKTKIPSSSKFYKPLDNILKSHIPNYLVGLLLILTILISPYLVQKIYYEFKISRINNLVKRINETIFKSKLSLAYQDQPSAQALLKRADSLMSDVNSVLVQLPEKVREKSMGKITTIREDLSDQQNTINNIINIDEPEEIADLSKNSFSFNPQGILKLENTLYFYELNSGFLYKIDLDTNEHVLVFLSSKETFKLGAVRDNSLILLSSPEKIYIYGKNDNYNTYLLKPSLENTLNIKDMTNFNESLYFVDVIKLNILKYAPQESVLNGTNWLTKDSNPELADAQSLAVDGSVYVSKADGTIIEYKQGKKAREIKAKVSPALNNGGQLFTNDQMKNLYILDQQNKRIITINKKDEFTIQYFSDKFDSLKDFWVDSGENTIYILNGTKVYKIDI